jgi:ATP-binding cassette subfamily B protein
MYRWFWSFVRPYRLRLALGFALVGAVSALAMANPLLAGAFVDRVLVGRDYGLVPRIVALLFGVTVVRMGLRWCFVMIFERSSQSLVKAMREDLFVRLQGLDYGFFDRTRTGDLMAMMTGDLDACRHMVSWVDYQSFENALVFGFSLAVLFGHHAGLAALLFTVVPFIAYFAWRLASGVRPMYGKVREAFSRLNSVVQENIAGNRVVKAFVREDEEMRKFDRENDAYRQANLDAAAVWGRYIPLIDGASGLILAIMLLGGGWLIIGGSLTLGTLVTFNGLIWALTQPLKMAGWLINDVQRFRASLERLYALSRTVSSLELPAAAAVPAPAPAPAAPAPDRVRGSFAFRAVDFAYGDRPALSGLDFQVEAGQTVGIVGPTGSGKSTLLRLLGRYYDPAAGQVLVDGIDARSWPLPNLRAGVGYAMQDVFLFSDTLEGNICFGKPDAPLDAVVEAARAARATEFIDRLPDGFDTVVGERGIGLSGGQRQRIALARLLLADPPVLVLDDTTSAVDLETERHLQETMRALHGKKTLFIVAHRLTAIMHADLILVMEGGRIVQRGVHADLIQEPGWYRTVWRHQLGRDEAA